MAGKVSAKNATVLINGSKFSTYATAYSVESSVNPFEVTGFGDGCKNSVPTIPSGKITADMFWDTTATTGVHAKMVTIGQTGNVTIIPETYAIGVECLSMPYTQTKYTPQANVSEVITIGTVEFESYGNNYGVEIGNVLYSGTITNTTSSSSFDNGAATSVKYSGIVHIWTPTAADSYAVKIEHSTNNSTWADLITFTIDGQSITSQRTASTGTVNRYRRITATRTGSAGNSFGFTVVLYAV